MKPISTEDKGVCIKYDKKTGILVMLIAVIIMIATSFYITPLSILDTDPSTYVIVPILMLPLFVLFAYKEKIEPSVTPKSIAAGTLLFAAFIALTMYLRYVFTFAYISFRIDLLLFPIAVLALAMLLFGVQNVKKFRAIAVYMLFASPAVLIPIINLNGGFAAFNSMIVYYIIHAFNPGAAYVAPITIIANGFNIGIGESCAGIGVMIGIIMFLAPVAYFYDGKNTKKFYWLLSSLLLLFLLNVARMASIGFVWLSGGPSVAVSFVHSFAGILLFYAAIIVMLLLAGKYGLRFPKIPAGKKSNSRNAIAAIAVALLLALFYLYVTLSYASSTFISPIQLQHYVRYDSSSTSMNAQIFRQFNTSGFITFALPSVSNYSTVIELENKTFNATDPIAMLITVPNANITKDMLNSSRILSSMAIFSSTGIKSQAYYLISNSTGFVVVISFVPFVVGNATTLVDIYAVFQASSLPSLRCNYNALYSTPLFAISNSSASGKILSAYCIASRIE